MSTSTILDPVSINEIESLDSYGAMRDHIEDTEDVIGRLEADGLFLEVAAVRATVGGNTASWAHRQRNPRRLAILCD